jgi:hypothetical protein
MSEETYYHEDKIFSLLLPNKELKNSSGDPAIFTEERLLQLLSEQIHYLMVHDKENLWSLFYRLDVTDASLREVLTYSSDEEEQASKFARLVLDRQKKRMATKQEYRQPAIDEDEWRNW